MWELFDNVIGTRGTDYDGIDVTANGNLDFGSNTSLQLVFDADGSDVDWTDAFWKTSLSGGSNRWKIFELTGTGSITGENNLVLPAPHTLLDKNGISFASVYPHALGFRVVKDGNALYLEYINTNAWTGTTSTDDATTSNWSLGRTPITGEGVRIADNASNDLVLSGNTHYRYVAFNSQNTVKIVLGNHDLTVDRAIIGADADRFVQTNGSGKVITTIPDAASFVYPIGNASYNPVTITNNSGASDVFSVKIRDEVLAQGTSGNQVTEPHVNVTWDIDKATANGGLGVDFVFQWNASQEQNSISSYRVQHYDGSAWEFANGTSLSVNGSTVKTMSHTDYAGTFSPFAIGESATLLPVTLLNFTVQAQGKTAVLDWTTTMEVNNSHFEVERSVDGTQWDAIGRVQGAGNTHKNTDYQFVDPQPQALNYYRLRQVDRNGSYGFSAICMLRFNGSESNALPMLVVSPNPAAGDITLRIDADGVDFTLYDMAGKSLQLGRFDKETVLAKPAAGMYLIKITYGDAVSYQKLIVE